VTSPVDPTRCKSCGSPVLQAISEGGRLFLVDTVPGMGGEFKLVARGDQVPRAVKVRPQLAFGRKDLHWSHSKTCPDILGKAKKRGSN
jgi:hypothetical protein